MNKYMTRFAPIPTTRFLSLFLGLILGSIAAANGGPITLDAPTLTSVDSTAFDLVNADFNNDGKLDSAVVNFSTNTLKILLGDGTGRFSAPTTFATPAGPHALITVDYNNDGKPDLLSANTTANSFTLFINDGSGNFTGTSYPSGFGPTAIAAGDFNNDNRLDVATTSESANTINYSLALAGGGFNAPVLISLPNAVPKYVLAADVNGDGRADLITANAAATSSNISVLLCDGMGNFSGPTNFTTGVNTVPNHISLGLFNADANLDAIVTLTGTNRVAFMAGAGNGTFTLTTSFTVPTGSIAVTTLLKDLNGDANLDLITVCYGRDQLIVKFGNGAGGVTTESTFYTAKQPHTVAAGDFNGDGLIDLNTIQDPSSTIALFLNRGPGSFPTARQLTTLTGILRTSDLNRDGKADIVIGPAGSNPSVFLGLGDGLFGGAVQVMGSGFNGTDLLIGDVNNDSFPDILTSGSSGNNGVSIHLNNGSGGFPGVINLITMTGKLGLGDFNNDGKTDLVITDSTTMTNNLRFFQGDGLGGFILTAAATFGGTPLTLTVADLNHDNRPDLIVTRGGGFGVMLWTGSYTFTAPAYYLPNCMPGPVGSLSDSSDFGTIALADFNRDGHVDIARGATGCAILTNNGSGVFAPLGGDTMGFFNPIVGDFDRNGIPDLAREMGDTGEMRVFYHDGAGHFTSTSYAAGRGGVSAVAADANSDGISDIFYVSSATSGSGTAGTFALMSRPLARGLTTADFDGDGKTDISVFRPSTGIWYILRSSNNTFYGVQFGANGDRPVPGDYDGDGKTDIAVYRAAEGNWFMLRSSDGAFVFTHHGTGGDIPVPGDYNGDGVTNIAVYRPSTGFWYPSTNPATNFDAVQWGAPGDIAAPADYDGDGRTDFVVFRPSQQTWFLLQSVQGFQQVNFGLGMDRPVPFDYDGDGRANLAVWRASSGTWYTSTNPATNFGAIQWGISSDLLVPGYYDADNRIDVSVYRDGTWYILNTATPTYTQISFGAPGDIPIPSMFVP